MVLCATGAYQCFTLPGFILSLLRHVADDVHVVLSASAARLVSPLAVAAASRHHVYVGVDGDGGEADGPALDLDGVDLVLVYPATANIVGKVAGGIADELVSAVVLSATAPVFFVPFANPDMWTHPAVRRNLERLSEQGYVVLPPQSGVEVATREGLAESNDPFPLPTLLPRLAAALSAGSGHGRARRG
jgi:phosphopantothenoylcysteine decarboxylase / phosphopantothenate---cysteine ligase